MMKTARWLVLSALVVAAVCALEAAPQERGGSLPAMVVIVRHAEKAAGPGRNPPLTDEGRVRARALAAVLDGAGVEAILTTHWDRTKETAAPAASAFKVVPEVIAAEGATAGHAAAVAAAARRHAGKVVLVVGHSDTLPAIISALAGIEIAGICSSAFDDLFVLVPVGERWRLVRSRYGALSPRASCQ